MTNNTIPTKSNVVISRSPDGNTKEITFDDNDTSIITTIITSVVDVVKTIIANKK